MENFNELQKKILKLKEEKDAIILAHYYVPLEVQDIADVVGDSFEMARRAAEAPSSTIVVCGVRFMAESAKLLSPDKTVLHPAPDAGCPMADMITPEEIANLRAEHPNAAVMCYVNSSAAVKAVSDICCTSSSALRVASSLEEDEIIFVPDQHLGAFTAEKVPEKTFHCHDGFCPTHHRITEADVMSAKEAHPGAVFLAHPECREEVLRHADFIGSTSEILKAARETEADTVIVGTEMEITRRLRREIPEKEIYSVSPNFTCVNMKRVTPEAVYESLLYGQYEVTLPEEVMTAARACLDRMIKV